MEEERIPNGTYVKIKCLEEDNTGKVVHSRRRADDTIYYHIIRDNRKDEYIVSAYDVIAISELKLNALVNWIED